MTPTHKITLKSGATTKTFYYTKKPNKYDKQQAIIAFGKGLNVILEVSEVKLTKKQEDGKSNL